MLIEWTKLHLGNIIMIDVICITNRYDMMRFNNDSKWDNNTDKGDLWDTEIEIDR